MDCLFFFSLIFVLFVLLFFHTLFVKIHYFVVLTSPLDKDGAGPIKSFTRELVENRKNTTLMAHA